MGPVGFFLFKEIHFQGKMSSKNYSAALRRIEERNKGMESISSVLSFRAFLQQCSAAEVQKVEVWVSSGIQLGQEEYL